MFSGSKKELLDLIKRGGTVKIDEAVEEMDLAKTTLREHLLQLERDGYIERTYERSGPGRPSLQYRLSNKGNSLYPSYESDLMRKFLQYLNSSDREELIEDFFEKFWEERYEKAQQQMDESGSELKEKLEGLMDMLEKEGFMPEFSVDEESEIKVKECNCPFREVIKETRLPCKLEAMFYSRLFEGNVERTSYIAEGDHSCTYHISNSKKE